MSCFKKPSTANTFYFSPKPHLKNNYRKFALTFYKMHLFKKRENRKYSKREMSYLPPRKIKYVRALYLQPTHLTLSRFIPNQVMTFCMVVNTFHTNALKKTHQPPPCMFFSKNNEKSNFFSSSLDRFCKVL